MPSYRAKHRKCFPGQGKKALKLQRTKRTSKNPEKPPSKSKICDILANHLINFLLLFQRLKGLVRPRPSSTTPLGKNVFGRSTPKQNSDVTNRDYIHDLMSVNQSQIIPNRNRTFLMDSQVMYTVVSELRASLNDVTLGLGRKLSSFVIP